MEQLEFTIATAKKAGTILKEGLFAKHEVKSKGKHDVVSDLDVLLVKFLAL
jgi:hypothetical protein